MANLKINAKPNKERDTILPPTPPPTDASSTFDSSSSEHDDAFPLPPPSSLPTQVLDIDKATPDAHVPRDPRMVRLTGVHPFNAEAPLDLLFRGGEGFLTPPELFFVRSHGAVPVISNDEARRWTFSVEGYVSNPLTISLSELLEQYEQVTIPATLVCAGNRRKEQNMVRKSNGFSWGPGGLSTALFTGVLVASVLAKAGIKKRARYLCMEGGDVLPNGNPGYGTCIPLALALSPSSGVLLSYAMNGAPLTPDHGRPLRVVVPGVIGGRSVKWLTRLIVTARPSENWYHLHDNKVLPAHLGPADVGPEKGEEGERWWRDEWYAIGELSVNSAVACPGHGERVSLGGGGDGSGERGYVLRGYAYAGGGRRVTRVEVSLDRGRSWVLAEVEYPEDAYRPDDSDSDSDDAEDLPHTYNNTPILVPASYCWAFWHLPVPLARLASAKDIVVRAGDESLALQPREMYWSVLGMMNNPWFRVVVHHAPGKDGGPGELWFEHPTQPGMIPGGWMERVKRAGGDLTDASWGESGDGSTRGQSDEKEPAVLGAGVQKGEEIGLTNASVNRAITLAEVREHSTQASGDAWFVIDGEVYDPAGYLDEHPGGAASVRAVKGTDTTEEFLAIHSEGARGMMKTYHIGALDAAGRAALAINATHDAHSEPEPTIKTNAPFLSPSTWRLLTLTSKSPLSHDTHLLTFSLPSAMQPLGLPVGQHVLLRLRLPSGKTLIKEYTPISTPSLTGSLEMLVKVYPAHPEDGYTGGPMSTALDALPLGAHVQVKGPFGRFEYRGRGRVSIDHRVEREVRTMVMLGAGSGVAPIVQVLRAVMEDEEDETRCVVFCANRGQRDVLLKDELALFAEDGRGRCSVQHILSREDGRSGWAGLRGRMGREFVSEHLGRWKGKDAIVLVCGPEEMENALGRVLREEGWGEEQVVFF
ncbi:nitrate reductase NiaD [Coniophora puteana RWD-64-598 SS2]|uniref:Nitrate reductase [NADPH] n=1 Tax=Coniophora puteana (strain RWD-64-598) TaxID=741705 RepID=A0A5M3N132_CONPW|nr:nitrate reductase NiaD [Coniophora puteana RWD-64-598 SS2]EIW84615.1 nitrate reductase NiaD [Coniophora puteana RWD-64-598 SS2]